MDAAAKKTENEVRRCTELADYFEQAGWTIVNSQWNIGLRCRCFDFQKGTRYLLDVDQAVFQNYETDKIIKQLEAAHWRNILETHAGKRIPRFGADGKFTDASTFLRWPALAKSARL